MSKKKILLRGGIKIFLIHVKRERIGSIVASLDSSFSVKKMFSRIWMETNPNFFGRGKKLLLVATGFFALGELRHFPSRAAKKVFEKRNRSTVLHPFFQISRNSKKTNDLSFHFILFQASSLSTCIAELRHAFLSVENRREGESSSAVKLNNFSPVPRRIH